MNEFLKRQIAKYEDLCANAEDTDIESKDYEDLAEFYERHFNKLCDIMDDIWTELEKQ